MRRGQIFVFEGGDGVGKTTLWRNFSNALGDKAEFFREPGGTKLGDALRSILLEKGDISSTSQLLMFMAARFQLIDKYVLPAVRSGRDVFLDRFDASTYAYQICGNDEPWLENVFSELRKRYLSILGDGELFEPHYILLKLDPEVAAARLRRRAEDKNHFDSRELEFHQRVQKGYDVFFERYVPNPIVVDASQSESEVFRKVSEIVASYSSNSLLGIA